MTRKLSGGKLVVASHNKGKVREIRDLLGPFGLDVVSASDLGLPEPEETGTSFRENAELKARAAAERSGLPSLSDDSGLCVEALDGAPGIYSARWAGEQKDFGLAMDRIERELAAKGIAPSGARAFFVCGLALAWPDGHVDYFEGRVNGALTFPPRGTQGFGYDPIFIAGGESISFGEMEPDRKHAMSHRADAFRQLVEACLVG
ncbi:MAG: RdgB/HAM1 family non-canonical purine NTP pyrophosphatase [Parvibaculaceae bacterium]|nr:RdgB/HAM1 family non-canonical purine NTP pyrophosphatase [Parvibaculaceae bacterium]